MVYWIVVSTAISMGVMFLLWLVAEKNQRADLVDIGWAACISCAAVLAALLSDGHLVQRFLPAGLVLIWSARLLFSLIKRLITTRVEDPRYQNLRRYLGSRTSVGFFLIFQIEALLVPLLTLPIFMATHRQMLSGDFGFIIGAALWLIGFVGETIADSQLERFKQAPSPDRVCNIGLWRYSRHPNYFFEWVMWVSYAVMALGHPWAISAFSAPLIMFVLLRWVTGVPPSESQAIASRGEAYRRYQNTTSAFFPLPRKNTSP